MLLSIKAKKTFLNEYNSKITGTMNEKVLAKEIKNLIRFLGLDEARLVEALEECSQDT